MALRTFLHPLHTSFRRFNSSLSVTFVTPPTSQTLQLPVTNTDSLLTLAHKNDIPLEGACEGSIACSTCHVILKKKDYEKLEPPTDEEEDMLDLAFGLTETSRLGCQIKMCPELNGLEVTIPAVTRNMAVDGYKPKPH